MLHRFVVLAVMGAILAGCAGKQGRSGASSTPASSPPSMTHVPSTQTNRAGVGKLSGLPGETIADAQLVRDVLPLSVMLVQIRSKCTLVPITIVDTKLTSIPEAEGWRESWIFSACSAQRYIVPIEFTRDEIEGTRFAITASEIRLLKEVSPQSSLRHMRMRGGDSGP